MAEGIAGSYSTAYSYYYPNYSSYACYPEEEVSSVDSNVSINFNQPALEDRSPPPSLAQGALGGVFSFTSLACDCHGIRLEGDLDANDYEEAEVETPVDADGDSYPDLSDEASAESDEVDGETAECEVGSVRQSYSGPSGTEGVGVCQAQIEECQETEEGVRWQIIQAEVLPSDEICGDGLDNNCNGITDYTRMGSDVRITNDPAYSFDPSLVWNGSGYGVAWTDERDGNHEAYFARLDDFGIKIGSEVRITNDPEISQNIALVWTGSEYGMVWEDSRTSGGDIYFTRISSTGSKIGADIRVTTDSLASWSASIVWNDSEYGVAWNCYKEGRQDIYFSRIDSSGVLVGPNVNVSADADPDDSQRAEPSIVWTGSGYGIAWAGSRYMSGPSYPIATTIYLSAFNSVGDRTSPTTRISDASGVVSSGPSLVWTGSEYGAAWDDRRDMIDDPQVYFARISSAGSKIGSDIRVSTGVSYTTYPFLVWDGFEFGVAYSAGTRDRNRDIYFAEIDPTGSRIRPDVRITSDEGVVNYPFHHSLTWTGSNYGVAWTDERDGNSEIYFARIGCQ